MFTEDVVMREEVFTCTGAGGCRLKVLYDVFTVYTHIYIHTKYTTRIADGASASARRFLRFLHVEAHTPERPFSLT